jgi:hypothetical protein
MSKMKIHSNQFLLIASVILSITKANAQDDTAKWKMKPHETDSVVSPSKVVAAQKAGEKVDIIITETRPLPSGYKGQQTLDPNKYPFLNMKVAAYREKATQTQEKLRKVLESIAKEVGNGTSADVPQQIKTEESTFRKLTQNLKYDARSLTDLARATLVFQSMKDLKNGLEMVKKHFDIEREVNRFDNPWEDGYRDLQLIVKDKDNGILAEVQLHLCHLKNYTEGESHKIYEQVRAVKGQALQVGRPLTPAEQNQITTLNNKSKDGYNKALVDTALDRTCTFSRDPKPTP